MGAYYGAGIGSTVLDLFDVQQASADELVNFAKQIGIDIQEFIME